MAESQQQQKNKYRYSYLLRPFNNLSDENKSPLEIIHYISVWVCDVCVYVSIVLSYRGQYLAGSVLMIFFQILSLLEFVVETAINLAIKWLKKICSDSRNAHSSAIKFIGNIYK